MKYVKNFDSFRYERSVNEGILGNIIKNIKNKISLNFSKMFGSAAKVDKLIGEYKKEILTAQARKREALKQYGEYVKSVKDSGEKDDAKQKELSKNIEIAGKNYDDQIGIIKQKFDIKFKEATKDEKNEKIQNYITLKKLEMQQELLQFELNSVLTDAGISEEDAKNDPIIQNLIKNTQLKVSENQKNQENQKKILESTEEKVLGFDINKAKEMANRDETYLWEKSPFKEWQFKKDDKVKFFSKSNKMETDGVVMEDSGKETDRIKVKTERTPDGFEINKGVIISCERYTNEKAEKKPAPAEPAPAV